MDKIFIGDVSFTPKIRTVEQNGRVAKLRNKESEILTLLCNSYPAPLSREQIEKSIWIESYVTDNTLTQTISNLRTAINDKKHELIITLPKKGYCLAIEPKFICFKNQLVSDESIDLNIKNNSKINFIYGRFTIIKWLGSVSIFLFFFYLSFLFFFNKFQVEIVHVKSSSLPIRINLNKNLDADFLNTYNKSPFLLLKKNSDDSYIACERHKGGLKCLRK